MTTALPPLSALENATEFQPRHIGIDAADEAHMLSVIGEASRRALIDGIVPRSIARSQPMDLPAATTEAGALAELKAIAGKNQLLKSFIGQGYYGTHTPGVILRNILENPAWYTAYTPYQAEISQGRMEALVNFQTMVCDLTAMPIANASMLDEATAAAEAMTLAKRSVKSKSNRFIVAGDAHPQTIEVIQTRAEPLGIEVVLANSLAEWNDALDGDYFAVLAQYPATSGRIDDLAADAREGPRPWRQLHRRGRPAGPDPHHPARRMGRRHRRGHHPALRHSPWGAGGPHAAFMACRDEYKRSLPGRLVGVSVDVHGKPAYRLALQTREQHIRPREGHLQHLARPRCCRPSSPACTPSITAPRPDAHRPPRGRLHRHPGAGPQGPGRAAARAPDFDTLSLHTGTATETIAARAVSMGANLRIYFKEYLCISLDETTTRADVELLWKIFAKDGQALPTFADYAEAGVAALIPAGQQRSSAFLTHPVFNTHHSETGMLRYIRQLSDKDLALDRSMIPLGSCTMKLNATSEMIPITWPEFAHVHPFAPADQLQGYAELDEQLRAWLCQATGYAASACSPTPAARANTPACSPSAAGTRRAARATATSALIPSSAHGTNPASAQMAGMQVVVTACDASGNVDLTDLKAKCEQHADKLACVMITYPSTHGVFETQVKELCQLGPRARRAGCMLDGANMTPWSACPRPVNSAAT